MSIDYIGTDSVDVITQNVIFDASSVVTALGQGGNDTILLNANNLNASIFVAGGAGSDNITVQNTGTTTIYGGNGSSDPFDDADAISFSGGGAISIFSNAGNDVVSLKVDQTGIANVFGGVGNDQITATGSGARIFVGGGEGSDVINVTNTGGATTIFGGISSADAGDAGDAIHVVGANNGGTWNIFANGGNDLVDATAPNAFNASANISIYGGVGQDTVSIGSAGTSAAVQGSKTFVAGGEGSDAILVNSNGSTTIWGGTSPTDAADGADTIQIFGSGTSFVFGNGGDDQITIGVNLQDASTVATVNGGAGDDTLTVASVSVPGANVGTITLTGGAGGDTFVMPSSAMSAVTVTDFNALEGDRLQLTGGGGVTGPVLGVLGNFNTMQDALNAATNVATLATGSGSGTLGGTVGGVVGTVGGLVGNTLGITGVTDAVGNAVAAAIGAPAAGQLTGVLQGGNAFLIINDGVAGFDPNADKVIKLTGVTNLADVFSHVTVV